MKREDALATWTPAESPWSPWTKAVLFAFLPEEFTGSAPTAARRVWREVSEKGVALLVELPGAEGVEVGVALARSGYRLVPLYNACPQPFPPVAGEPGLPSAKPPTVVDVSSILRALEEQTATLQSLRLAASAPPAFLLDAKRGQHLYAPKGGWFDNRSVVRESDVPTAGFLQAQGIREVVLIQRGFALPRDLCLVLRAWQEGGLTLARQDISEDWHPRRFTVPKPWALRIWWERLMMRAWYPLKADGTFGRFAQDAGG